MNIVLNLANWHDKLQEAKTSYLPPCERKKRVSGIEVRQLKQGLWSQLAGRNEWPLRSADRECSKILN